MAVDVHQSSQQWLKVHGLEAKGLSLSQILRSLGFQQSSGEVECLGHPVTSQYCTGLFLQHADYSGHVYNLVDASEERLRRVEDSLSSAICCLKQRLHWLNSGSRKTCGVVGERRVLLAVVEERLSTARDAAVSLLQDQGSHLTQLNIIRGSSLWKSQSVAVRAEVISEAIQWLLSEATPNSSHETTSMLKGVTSYNQMEAIYVIAEGSRSVRDVLSGLAKEHFEMPVHVVVVDCQCHDLLKSCQDLASATGGRCHSDGDKKGILCLPRQDVLAVWQELEQARDTLAQIQALCMEVAEKTKAYYDSTAETDSKLSNSKKKYNSHCQSASSKTTIKALQSNDSQRAEKSSSIRGRKARRKATVRQKRQRTRPISQTLPQSVEVQHSGNFRMPVVGSILACSKQDGFYYKGNVISRISRQRVVVRFHDHSLQTTSLNQLIPVGGAGPHPQLRSEDYVLCCVRQKQGRHCSQYGICDFYIPAQVQVLPRDTGHALFSVTTFDEEHISCARSSLKKISKTRYSAICSYIAHCQQQSTMTSGAVTSGGVETSNDSTHQRQLEYVEDNSLSQNIESNTPACSKEETEVTVSQHNKDRATSTDVLETIERGTCVTVPTQEQGVGTGPQMVDGSTATEDVSSARPHSSSLVQGAEASNRDTVDYSKPSEPGVGNQVFCSLPETGWCYRASVLGRGETEASWIVKTELGEIATIPSSHIIPLSSSSPMTVDTTVLAPHPLASASFAPGSVLSVDSQMATCCIAFYDGLQEADVPQKNIHFLPPEQHKAAVMRLQERDNRWIGQAVIARRDDDGVYYPAVVTGKLDGQCYQVQWTDGSHQTQSRLHIYGRLSSNKSLHAGDHVLALAMFGIGACLPGTVTATETSFQGGVEVRFSDGERQTLLSKQCFWIDPAYFISAVEYISNTFSIGSDKHALCQ